MKLYRCEYLFGAIKHVGGKNIKTVILNIRKLSMTIGQEVEG